MTPHIVGVQFLQTVPRAGAPAAGHPAQLLPLQVRVLPEDAGWHQGQPDAGPVPGAPRQQPVRPDQEGSPVPGGQGVGEGVEGPDSFGQLIDSWPPVESLPQTLSPLE